MESEYDRETDILLVRLSDETPDHGDQVGNVITHYTDDGTPVQIEILDASETVLELIRPMFGQGEASSASG